MNRKLLASTLSAAALSFGIAHAATITINAGGSSLAYPTYVAEFKLFTQSNPSDLFSYEAVGSGAGQKAFIGNNITYFEPVSGSNSNGYAAGTLTYGTIVGTAVDIGASDAFLTASQLTNPATGSYTESSVDGPLIQIPTLGVPVTVAFVPPTGDKITTLDLTDAQVCGIFSGKITSWNTIDASVAASPITIVYRSDSSGTTFLLSQHLDAVCNSSNSTFTGSLAAPTKTFTSLFSSISTSLPTAIPASGSGGVQTALLATPGSISYLSPDYTAIAPKSANTSKTVQVASLYNADSKAYYTPSVANTEAALKAPGAGATDSTAPNTKTLAANPLNWVPAIPQPTTGYPIVGYTTIDLSTCYANKAIGTAIVNVLTDSFGLATYSTIVTNNGFAPLANDGSTGAGFANAIKNDFTTNTSKFGLDIDDATTCASYGGR